MLHRHILLLNAALDVRGLFDTRGRLRVSWLSKLESLMREARAFDTSLRFSAPFTQDPRHAMPPPRALFRYLRGSASGIPLAHVSYLAGC